MKCAGEVVVGMSLGQLAEWLEDRTIGVYGEPPILHWRGPGYDEGWADLTPEEVATFKRLVANLGGDT